MEEELKKVAQVVYNKIQNENIKYYEKAAYELGEYEGNNYAGRELLPFVISTFDIERAILYREDLNFINGIDMKQYVEIDLNEYLSKVLLMLENKMASYAKIIENASMEELSYLEMEYFTFEESLQLQEEFSRKRDL